MTYVDIGCGLQLFEVNVYRTGERDWGECYMAAPKRRAICILFSLSKTDVRRAKKST